MLIKTGQMAKQAGILPWIVQFYVREGIRHPAGQTPGGYCLFDGKGAVGRLRQIDKLQIKQGLTLRETKQELSHEWLCDRPGVEGPGALS